MTEKAKKILQKTQLRRLFGDPQRRDQILRDFNDSTFDQVGPLGGEKGERFVKELNEMQDLDRDAGRRENPQR